MIGLFDWMDETTRQTFFIAFTLLGSLALLVFGMKMMSETLQKMAGPGLRHVLGRMTTNRFTGMLTGVVVTSAVQSSTATTVMTVSFVNAGLLTLAQAISIIMGANIGTTLTAWIMSAGFLSFNVTDFVWPAFVLALILIYRKRQANIGYFLFGIAFMFLGLGTLRQTGTDMRLGEQQAVLDFFASFDPQSYLTTLLFLLIGGVLTMCVQSSAAVMAITMILCSSGALPIYQGIALVMGENIGTTVTSNLAALTASTQARRAAFAHMFFNLFGVCWMMIVFHPFVDMVCNLVGYDTELTREAGETLFLDNAAKLSIVLAAFHTCFNVANTLILIGFIPQIEKIVCAVIKPKNADKGKSEDDDPTRLVYIEGGLMQAPEIAVLQAQKEVGHYSERTTRMFGMISSMLEPMNDEQFEQMFERVEKYEGISDRMEIEIANYLGKVSGERLSDDTKGKIRSMMRQIGEIESIGDSFYNLARTLNRQRKQKEMFTEGQLQNVHQMMNLVEAAIIQMNLVLQGRKEDYTVDETYRIENEINLMRDRLKADNINAINAREYSYALATHYSDFISECEHLGDYIVNVVEARFGK